MKKKACVFILVSLFSASSLAASESSQLPSQAYKKNVPGKSAAQSNESFLVATRLLMQKRQQDMLAAQQVLRGADRRSSNLAAKSNSKVLSTSLSRESLSPSEVTAVYNWITTNQSASPLGLLVSYPEDNPSALPNLPANQAFTYDQALAGIVMLAQGDAARAEKILDFYINEYERQQTADSTGFDGFYNVYNSRSGVYGPRVEYHRHTGPNAWVALFALHYYSHTGDVRAYTLANNTAKWIIDRVPHSTTGGVAMGNQSWNGSAAAVSVENNISYTSVLKGLQIASLKLFNNTADNAKFGAELQKVFSFLKNYGYNASTGLMNRGLWDFQNALDVNSWLFLIDNPFYLESVPNAPAYVNETHIGLDIERTISKMEQTFAVQNDGSFGGNIFTARGFDFGDMTNAANAARNLSPGPGMKWLEGTNHMVLVYKILSNYYRYKSDGYGAQANLDKANLYLDKAKYFFGLNSANQIFQNGSQSYPYADVSSVRAWWDIPGSEIASGPSIASTAWVYFASKGFDPMIAPFTWSPYCTALFDC